LRIVLIPEAMGPTNQSLSTNNLQSCRCTVTCLVDIHDVGTVRACIGPASTQMSFKSGSGSYQPRTAAKSSYLHVAACGISCDFKSNDIKKGQSSERTRLPDIMLTHFGTTGSAGSFNQLDVLVLKAGLELSQTINDLLQTKSNDMIGSKPIRATPRNFRSVPFG
jgi:hypothetical protein